jgi:sigma-B regulation protein RsbU (phosphoserine phosphatase)
VPPAPPPPPPPPPPPGSRGADRRGRADGHTESGTQRFERFLRDYTSGIDGRELRGLLDRDAPRVYSVLTRDRSGEPRPKEPGFARFWWDTRVLFLSVSEKLTPGRRAIFAGSLIAALVGFFGIEANFQSEGRRLLIDASPLPFLLAIGGLLFLLASELVDRVLVRDELEVARALQRSLLPQQAPLVPGWQLAFSLRTANDIGGDYLRFEPLADGRLALVVADASGHGMAAGLLMAITDTALRIGFEQSADPTAVAHVLHRAVLRTGDRRAFVTAFLAVLDPATGQLEFVGAGHPSPLLRRADGRLEEPLAGSLPAGLRERFVPVSGRLALAPGETLMVCTDGLFEALAENGEPIGWERLRREVSTGGSARELHDRLRRLHDDHTAGPGLTDDCTLLVLRREAPGQAAGAGPPR